MCVLTISNIDFKKLMLTPSDIDVYLNIFKTHIQMFINCQSNKVQMCTNIKLNNIYEPNNFRSVVSKPCHEVLYQNHVMNLSIIFQTKTNNYVSIC